MSISSKKLSNTAIQRLLLVFVVFTVYGSSLANGFVWDDTLFFIGNPVYSQFNLRAIFLSPGNGQEYLPLRDLTYGIDYLLWGENPVGFHLSNLIFFTITILLVHHLAGMLMKRCTAVSGKAISPLVPFAVAAGFALHPFNAEAVNFITCRNVLVSGAFFFLACICTIRCFDNQEKIPVTWYLAALLAFTGGLLSKATVIMLPLLLLAILPLLFPVRLKQLLVFIASFLVISVCFFVAFKKIAVDAKVIDQQSLGFTLFNFKKNILLAIQIPFFYLKKLIIPYGFSAEYDQVFNGNFLSLPMLFCTALLFCGMFASIRAKRTFPVLTIGFCWFMIALLPVMNFFNTIPVVADRYVYLPTFGFMLIVSATLDRLLPLRIKPAVTTLILLALAALSLNRSLDWRSDETLWKANIRFHPNNTKSYLNLANFYCRNKEYQQALNLLTEHQNVPWLNLYYYYYKGHYLYEQNKVAEAKESFQYALKNIESGFISGLYYLGLIAEQEGDFMAAAIYYNRALASKEGDPFLHSVIIKDRVKNLKKTWLDQYVASMNLKIAQNPVDLNAYSELALLLDHLGFSEEALKNYLFLEKSGVKNWQIYQNIANCYYNMDREKEAISYYEKVLTAGGTSEDVLNNLGVAYRKARNFDKSLEVLTEGVTAYPASAFMAFNRAATLFEANRLNQARSAFIEVNQKFPDLKNRTEPYILEISKH